MYTVQNEFSLDMLIIKLQYKLLGRYKNIHQDTQYTQKTFETHLKTCPLTLIILHVNDIIVP